jgi:hypothetical protein
VVHHLTCRLPQQRHVSLDVRERVSAALTFGIGRDRVETLPARKERALERLGIPTREFSGHTNCHRRPPPAAPPPS